MLARRAATFVFLLVLSVAAQAQSGSRDTVVRAAAKPVHAKLGTLVQEQSIGVVDGAEEYMFGDVADVAIGNDGSLFVVDRKVPIVRQYDAQGKFVRNVGRAGAGPGEYRSISGLAIARDGKLLLWDTGNWRINVYGADGKPVTQWLTPSGSANSTATYSRAIMVDTAGVVWCRGSVFKRDANGPTRRSVWFRVDAGGIRDTVELPPMPTLSEPLVATSPNGNASASGVVPFTPQPFVAKSPNGSFVTGFPQRYAFEILTPGKPVTSIRRTDAVALSVSAAERASERERIETMLRRTQPNWSWNGPEIPRTHPYYAGLSVGLDGRIWVAIVPEVSRRIGSISNMSMGVGGAAPPPPLVTREREPQPALYDLFEPDGTYIGQVQVPPRVSSVLRRGNQVWVVAYDEDDVATIKRYRINWP
jgi:hypothetical protein